MAEPLLIQLCVLRKLSHRHRHHVDMSFGGGLWMEVSRCGQLLLKAEERLSFIPVIKQTNSFMLTAVEWIRKCTWRSPKEVQKSKSKLQIDVLQYHL